MVLFLVPLHQAPGSIPGVWSPLLPLKLGTFAVVGWKGGGEAVSL